MSSYNLHHGTQPLLISMPHNGTEIPEYIKQVMTDVGLAVDDTDWYMDKLYDFAKELGVYILKPTYNRYVIDLNRDPNGVDLYPGANSTELCPTTSFEEQAIYQIGKLPDTNEINARIDKYWQPYHQAIVDTLAEIKEKFGVALLLEAHSIRSHVPRFFEGQLPDFNFGNGAGSSCSESLMNCVEQLDLSPYSKVTNGRFKGGFITRNYGQPEQNIHALQLELSQRTYMQEPSSKMDDEKTQQVKPKLALLVKALLDFANSEMK